MLLATVALLAHNPLSKMPDAPEAWCDASLPRNIVLESRTFLHGHTEYPVELLQEVPVVAAVRGFASESECADIVEMTNHWLRHPHSRRKEICGKKDCGCWYDVLMENHSAPSSITALSNRTTALLRSLSGAVADYSEARPPGQVRVQLYNVQEGDKGAWCAPHCDSACNGESLSDVPGLRAVAMVSCKVAEVGGETSLSMANVVYKPLTVGDLVVFGIKQDNERIDVDGRTEHAGCPVTHGEKWILTIRISEGPSASRPPDLSASEAVHDFYDAPVPGQPLVLLKGSDVRSRRAMGQPGERDLGGRAEEVLARAAPVSGANGDDAREL